LETPNPNEPFRIAKAVEAMSLRYVVVTSVTRDDLSDGGAHCFAETIDAIHARTPEAMVEVLVPDFQGDQASLRTVLDARPDVLNHNLETVPRLYSLVRPGADYRRSLDLLRGARCYAPAIATKSGLMLGLGESSAEIRQTLQDLLDVGCRMLTLGQYLQPTKEHLPVKCFIPPETFTEWRGTALGMGFEEVASGPFVRSSYHAKELYQALGSAEE